MEYSSFWKYHSVDIMDKLVDVYQKIEIPEEDIDKFLNIKFDEILRIIGDYYADKTETQPNANNYSIAYDIIVNFANTHNKKKSRFKYWISKKQIKSLRKAYCRIYSRCRDEDKKYFVRVPYNTIYILNTVYEIVLTIDRAIEKIYNKKLSDYLAKSYIDLYLKEVRRNPAVLDLSRARELRANIMDDNQPANKIFRG